MIKSIVLLMINMLTTEAMISPISPMKNRLPRLVRSFLVKYPKQAVTPNVPAVTKNVFMIAAGANITKMYDNVAPLRAANIVNMNVVDARERLGFHALLLIFQTNTSSAIMMPQNTSLLL